MITTTAFVASVLPLVAGVLLACEFRGRGLSWLFGDDED